jgi:hypothetical protein
MPEFPSASHGTDLTTQLAVTRLEMIVARGYALALEAGQARGGPAATKRWTEERNRSPSGLPIMRCRVRTMGAAPSAAPAESVVVDQRMATGSRNRKRPLME